MFPNSLLYTWHLISSWWRYWNEEKKMLLVLPLGVSDWKGGTLYHRSHSSIVVVGLSSCRSLPCKPHKFIWRSTKLQFLLCHHIIIISKDILITITSEITCHVKVYSFQIGVWKSRDLNIQVHTRDKHVTSRWHNNELW